jgi:hypothetical protein
MCAEIREKFHELYSKDVSKYVEKKNGLSYISWANAWAEFKKIYPDAAYEVKKDDQGRCYFGDENIGYMVYTTVTAGGLTYEMWLPVMDANNKAMKMNAYTYSTRGGERTVEAIDMFAINKTVMRCLVKNLSMFGLGLYIYSGEDIPEDIIEHTCADCGCSVDSAMAARTQKAFGTILCKECGIKRAYADKAEADKAEAEAQSAAE